METLMQNVTSEASQEDLAVLNEINKGLMFYNGYYQRLGWFKSGLNYSLYWQVKNSFSAFLDEIQQKENQISISNLFYYQTKLFIIQKSLQNKISNPDIMLTQFFIDAIEALKKMISELLEAKKTI